MKKLTRKPTFNDFADKAAVNCWRDMYHVFVNPNSKWCNASDKKVLAKIRMRNMNMDGHGHGYAFPSFRCPTNCKSGFFSVLRYISWHPGTTFKQATAWAGVKSLAQMFRRLSSAKLIESKIENDVNAWYMTAFGKEYLSAAFNTFVIDDVELE